MRGAKSLLLDSVCAILCFFSSGCPLGFILSQLFELNTGGSRRFFVVLRFFFFVGLVVLTGRVVVVAAKFEDLLPSHLGSSHTGRRVGKLVVTSCLVVGGHSQLCCHHHHAHRHGSIV